MGLQSMAGLAKVLAPFSKGFIALFSNNHPMARHGRATAQISLVVPSGRVDAFARPILEEDKRARKTQLRTT